MIVLVYLLYWRVAPRLPAQLASQCVTDFKVERASGTLVLYKKATRPNRQSDRMTNWLCIVKSCSYICTCTHWDTYKEPRDRQRWCDGRKEGNVTNVQINSRRHQRMRNRDCSTDTHYIRMHIEVPLSINWFIFNWSDDPVEAEKKRNQSNDGGFEQEANTNQFSLSEKL